jgi:hypothetical protein
MQSTNERIKNIHRINKQNEKIIKRWCLENLGTSNVEIVEGGMLDSKYGVDLYIDDVGCGLRCSHVKYKGNGLFFIRHTELHKIKNGEYVRFLLFGWRDGNILDHEFVLLDLHKLDISNYVKTIRLDNTLYFYEIEDVRFL